MIEEEGVKYGVEPLCQPSRGRVAGWDQVFQSRRSSTACIQMSPGVDIKKKG